MQCNSLPKNRRIERGQFLNLPYDFAKSGLIHFFPKTSKAAPKTEENFQHLPAVKISFETVIRPICTLSNLGVYLDHKLQMIYHTDTGIAKGN